MIGQERISDEIGASTLDVISKADNFNKWMYQTVKPFCKGNVLEIGSGIGNISQYFLEDDFSIMLTDFRKEYCDLLNEKYGNKKNCLAIDSIDLVHHDFDTKYKIYLNSFDTVFALNVVEHIQDDLQAIKNAKKMLKPNGNLIILVPAYQSLYNKFDKGLGHFRRYTSTGLQLRFRNADLQIIHKSYFNFIGILGWFLSGKILGKSTIPDRQMNLFNNLVPVIRSIDKLTLNRMGLSIIVVGTKTTLI